jgi:rubrerythrin
MRDSNQHAWNTVWEDSSLGLVNLKLESQPDTDKLSPAIAREKLIRTLKNAYSGELGAINAYTGHRKSVSDPAEKMMIYRIELEEIYHRERVGEILSILGEAPSVPQDRTMGWIGKTLGYLCSLSGWFAPMYGAGLLESRNIKEYEEAAEYALVAGYVEFLDDLLTMAEVEWEHEKFFREKCRSHFLYHWFPKWQTPPARETIRSPFIGIEYPEGPLSSTMNAEFLVLCSATRKGI